MYPVARKIKRNIHWKIHVVRNCVMWYPEECNPQTQIQAHGHEYNFNSQIFNRLLKKKNNIRNQCSHQARSKYQTIKGERESKLQFYFTSTLNPSFGSWDSTSFLYTHVSQKWILKLNSGTHVQRPVLTDQSAGQTAGGARRTPPQTNQKSGFGLSQSITQVQGRLRTVKARQPDRLMDRQPQSIPGLRID